MVVFPMVLWVPRNTSPKVISFHDSWGGELEGTLLEVTAVQVSVLFIPAVGVVDEAITVTVWRATAEGKTSTIHPWTLMSLPSIVL